MAYEREATVKPGIDKPRGNARRRYQTAQQYICIENDAHQRSGAMHGQDRATDSAKFDIDNPLHLSRIGVGVTLAHIAHSFAKHRAIDRILNAEIGRASSRERVGEDSEILGGVA